jgi:threonylcarbamoyladenosine tRNA methylthiotransferase MtaB
MDRKGPLKVALTALGCKVNQTDAQSLAADLEAEGHRIVSYRQMADVYILYTCTVTQRSDYQSRQMIRRALQKNPQGQVVVTGCYAQTQPEALRVIPGIDSIVGVGQQGKILDLLGRKERTAAARLIHSPIEEEILFRERSVPSWGHRHRAFLKIQDGCNSFCSYCIVPFSRGRNRSLPLDRILSKTEELRKRGFQEIVLTGIHLGTYGEDLRPRRSLRDLLEALEAKHPKMRLRLSSIEPGELDPPLIDFLSRSQTVCPHLHIPLQSGDDGVLRAMNRSYSASFYEDLVHRLVRAIPGLAIGADVIGGFPGEDEGAFQNTVRLIERLPIAYLHVFPFSKRPGTQAAVHPGQVPSSMIKERCRILRELSWKKRRAFYSCHLGQTVKVFIEGKDREEGFLRGYSDNYIPVRIPRTDDHLLHQICDVQLTEVQGDRVLGIPRR